MILNQRILAFIEIFVINWANSLIMGSEDGEKGHNKSVANEL
jgi:hypothetical protein